MPHCKKSHRTFKHIWFFADTQPNAKKPKELEFSQHSKDCWKLSKIKFYFKKILHIFDNICQVKYFKLKTTGEIIREKREEKGLLLRHVSALLDIDTAILSKIERGERKASREQIEKLSEILELNKEKLIIQFLSEKILYELKDDDLGLQALKVAEKNLKYGVTKSK